MIASEADGDAFLEHGADLGAECRAMDEALERDEAEAFVARLKPGGGTNLYDAIKLAFGDAEVDTIFILSDGEPSVSVTDVNRIRKDVQAWNEHRNIQINTIGIGSKLKVLEWLAEDSGGKHIKLR